MCDTVGPVKEQRNTVTEGHPILAAGGEVSFKKEKWPKEEETMRMGKEAKAQSAAIRPSLVTFWADFQL